MSLRQLSCFFVLAALVLAAPAEAKKKKRCDDFNRLRSQDADEQARIRENARRWESLDDGETVTTGLITRIFEEEGAKIAEEIRDAMSGFEEEAIEAELHRYRVAQETACAIFIEPEFRPFLSMSSDLIEG